MYDRVNPINSIALRVQRVRVQLILLAFSAADVNSGTE
jgi:hypothetical protein